MKEFSPTFIAMYINKALSNFLIYRITLISENRKAVKYFLKELYFISFETKFKAIMVTSTANVLIFYDSLTHNPQLAYLVINSTELLRFIFEKICIEM